MKPLVALMVSTVGVMASTKPSHENFRIVAGNLQTKMMNAGMKKADDGSLTFALFGGLAKEMITSQMDMKVVTYDYVVCKVGILSFNVPNKENKDKVERKYYYTVGICNKWIDGNQVLLKKVIDVNDRMFKNSLDKVQL